MVLYEHGKNMKIVLNRLKQKDNQSSDVPSSISFSTNIYYANE